MKAKGIEADFVNELMEARPEDCFLIIQALYDLEGREDENGEITPLGRVTGAIVTELFRRGIMKFDYQEDGAEA